VIFDSKKSSNLPGVHIYTSFPSPISFICFSLSSPPIIHKDFIPNRLKYGCATLWICWTNSRVGAKTIAIGPSSGCNGGCLRMWNTSGRIN
jgi:hypothetical protein